MKLNRIKIAVDVVIALVLVLLYNVHADLGLAFHEWAGILVLVGFVVHVVLSWGWVVGVTRKFFATTPRARVLYVLDVLVALGMLWTILSGVFISRIAVPALAVGAAPLWRTTHVPISYLTLIVVGVHLGMHWEWVLRVVRRLFGASKASAGLTWALRAVALVVLAGGVYSVMATDAVGQATRWSGGGHGQVPLGGPEGTAPGGGGFPAGGGGPSGDHTPGMGRGQGGPGQGMGRGQGGPGQGMGHGQAGRAGGSDLTSLVLHSGVIAAFAVPTYYLDDVLARRRRSRRRERPAA